MQNSKIKNIIRQTIKNYKIDRIILFGSHARGDYTEKSDYDILIVLKNNISFNEKRVLFTRISRKFAHKLMSVDIIIKSVDEINYYRNKIGSIVKVP